MHGNSVLQTWLFCLLGCLETKLGYLSDVFFPCERTNWIVIAEKCLKLLTWWTFECVCKVTSDQGSMFLDAACHTAETLQIETWMGCFKPSLLAAEHTSAVTAHCGHFLCVVLEFLSFACTRNAHTCTCPHRYVEMKVGMAKIPVLVGNSSAFDQCWLSVNSFLFFSTATWSITAWQK